MHFTENTCTTFAHKELYASEIRKIQSAFGYRFSVFVVAYTIFMCIALTLCYIFWGKFLACLLMNDACSSSKSPENVNRQWRQRRRFNVHHSQPGKYCVCVCVYAAKAVLRDVENNGKTVCHLVTYEQRCRFQCNWINSYLVE